MNYIADLKSAFFGTQYHPLSGLAGVGRLTSTFLGNAVVVAGVILIGLIILGGIRMITGAGDSNPAIFKSGQQIITAAIIGFMIVFLSYWIVGLLQATLGVEILYKN